MDRSTLKRKMNDIMKHKFLYLSVFIICMGISWGAMNFIYSQTINAKDDALLTKDTLIEDKNSIIEQYQESIKNKDDAIEELRHEILKTSLRNNALNISIQNSNLQSTTLGNWSCAEKDVIIGEFATKITNQDKAIQTCQESLIEKEATILELEKQIPAYTSGFVGKEISVGKGGSYQADGGRFIISVVNTEALSYANRYQTSFKLNGVSYTKTVGDSVTFEYYGENYTINLRSTSNPAKFYVYKNED